MSKKHKNGPPTPKGNQSQAGPQRSAPSRASVRSKGAPASEQDAKRRLGNFETAGEHAIEQPGGKQGPNR